MTTHARGAVFLMPEVRSALDLGALHARAIRMDERGKVLGHRMTSQCASGTGQFRENIARYLGAARGRRPGLEGLEAARGGLERLRGACFAQAAARTWSLSMGRCSLSDRPHLYTLGRQPA
jgi:hypothetical protein